MLMLSASEKLRVERCRKHAMSLSGRWKHYATFRYGRYGEVHLFSNTSQNDTWNILAQGSKMAQGSNRCFGSLFLFHPPFSPRTSVRYTSVGLTWTPVQGSGANYGYWSLPHGVGWHGCCLHWAPTAPRERVSSALIQSVSLSVWYASHRVLYDQVSQTVPNALTIALAMKEWCWCLVRVKS
jgi:hypothetical protein